MIVKMPIWLKDVLIMLVVAFFAIGIVEGIKNIHSIAGMFTGLFEHQTIPVQDTPEYKSLQREKDELKQEITDMQKRDMDSWKTHIIDSLTINGYQNNTKQSYIIYKDKNKQVEKNSNNTNISDLHNRIKLLPKY